MRILIIEDQPLIALDLQAILENNDVGVVDWASDNDTARRMIDDCPPDVALVDFLLDSETAESSVALLAAKGIPFAFCTASETRELSSHHPNIPILRKPFIFDDVLGTIDRLLKRPSPPPSG